MKKDDALKALGLTHQEPQPAMERSAPKAGKYCKRAYTPCPWCGRIMYQCGETMRQSVICLSTRVGIAYLQSRCCPTRGEARNGVFKLPVA